MNLKTTRPAAAPASEATTFHKDKAAFDTTTAGFAFLFGGFGNGIALGDVITLNNGSLAANYGSDWFLDRSLKHRVSTTSSKVWKHKNRETRKAFNNLQSLNLSQ